MRWRARPFVIVALIAGSIACSRSPTAPTPLSVSGHWVMDNPSGVANQTTSWELNQSGPTVTGTSSRTASFFASDTGTVSGVVSGSSFNVQWQTVTDFGGDGVCRVQTTMTTGMLTIADGAMRGVLTSVPQPPCTSRASMGDYSFTKR